MHPHDVRLSLRISVLTSHRPRVFLLQEVGTEAETHSWTLCRQQAILDHSVLNETDACITPPPRPELRKLT